MGIMVFSLLCVMQDLDHQPHVKVGAPLLRGFHSSGLGLRVSGLGFRALGLELRVYGFRVVGLGAEGSRVSGLGFKGLGFRLSFFVFI